MKPWPTPLAQDSTAALDEVDYSTGDCGESMVSQCLEGCYGLVCCGAGIGDRVEAVCGFAGKLDNAWYGAKYQSLPLTVLLMSIHRRY